MNLGITSRPVPTTQAPSDLYPELNQIQFSPAAAKVMRQHGLNPTQFEQQFDKAHATGDYAKKAQLAQQYALITDRVHGGNAASLYLDSVSAAPTPQQQEPVMNSVGTKQAFFGSIKNGFVDMVEAVPQLLTSGAGLTGIIDKQQWDKAHKGIEDTFSGLKTYVSQDYQKPLVSYSDQDGFDTNFDVKSLVGTTGTLLSYILPGVLTAGAGSLATIGARAGLAEAATATEAATHLARLTKAGKLATQATGLTSFLQTFPSYQREALANGLDIHDATLFAIPVAGLNAVIETANMGNLTKALGISPKAAQAAVREASLHEAAQALTRLANQELTPDLLMETGQQAVKNALGILTKPQEVGYFSKLVSGLGGRVKKGFLEQGIPEGGEEFFQSLVEDGSKQLYNNLAGSDSTGRFADKSFGEYAFNALYSTGLGAVIGTLPGTFLQSRQADPTVFGYVASSVRNRMQKGISLGDMLSTDPGNPNRLPILGVLDHKLATEQHLGEQERENDPALPDVRFTADIHADLVGKVSRMARIAHDFADVQTFGDADRKTMFTVSEAKDGAAQRLQTVADAKSQYAALSARMSDASLGFAEQTKAQVARGLLDNQLGKLVDTPAGQVFQAEQDAANYSQKVQQIVDQAMGLYANDEARPVINQFVSDNLTRLDRENGQVSYPDDFAPKHVLSNPATGDTLVTDDRKLLFRKLNRQGGKLVQPALVDAEGNYQPAVYEAQADRYENPVENLDTHLNLASSLSERGGMKETTPYRKPDNSVEGSWLRDGQQLVTDLQALQASKGKGKKAALAQTQRLASAYLQSSGFLTENERYAEPYADLASNLHSLLTQTGQGASTSEADALPIGDDVDLLAEGLPSTNTPTDLATTTNESVSTTPARPRPLSTPFDLPSLAVGSSTPEPSFADELQGTIEEEQRRDAGSQLSKATGELAAALTATESDAVGTRKRLLESIEQANSSLTAELDANADPASQRPLDEGAVSPSRPDPAVSPTANDVIESTRPSKRRSKPSFAQSFVPTDLQGAILSYFARNNKINQADFDRVAGAKTRIGAGGGNPFFKYLDPANRQQPLDTVARSITESIGQSELDQQSVEQAVVDAVTTFRRGNGPSQQLLEKYTEPEQQQPAENDAALDDALDSIPEEDRAVWASTPDALDVLQTDVDELLDQYTEEEINRLAEALFIHGYVDEHGQVDTDALIADLPAIESGLLDFEPAGVALYQRMRESVIFAQHQIAPILDAARERVSQQPDSQQVSPSVSKNNDVSPSDAQPATTADNLDDSGTDQRDDATDAGGFAGEIGSPAESPSSAGAERTGERTAVEQELVSVAATDPRTAEVTASYDIELANTQKQIEAKQREIEKVKKDLTKRTETGHRGSGSLFASEPVDPSIFIGIKYGVNGYAVKQIASMLTSGKVGQAEIDTALQTKIGDEAELRAALPSITDADFPVLLDYFYNNGSVNAILRAAVEYNATAKPKPTKAQTDLFANETSGLDAEQSAKNSIAQKEAELAALVAKQADLQQQKLRAIETALEASQQQANLFEQTADNTPAKDLSVQTVTTNNEGDAAQQAIESAQNESKPEAEAEPRQADEESFSAEQQAEADETLTKLMDFGQKIGAARKDTAERGFSRSKGDQNEPAWSKSYKVLQNARDKTFEVALTKGHFAQTLRRGFATREEAEAAIPLVAVSRNHRVYQKATGNYAIYRVYSNGKTWTIQEGFSSRADAEKYMAQHAESIITKKSPIIERPHLDKIERNRTDYRKGKNVTPEQFIDTFGFRGGEFGNWLAADERQTILNMAYDAFRDLAHALNVPPRTLSLGGELSIGFGSRGKGLAGGGAAAHYETSRAVINLTKVKGAGTLAHEWFHAFDNYLAKQDGKAPSQRNEAGIFEPVSRERAYFSHGKSSRGSGVRAQLSDAFDAIWQATTQKTIQRERDVAKTSTALQSARDYVQKGIADLRKSLTNTPSYGRKYKLATEAQLVKFDQLAEALLAGNLGERTWYKREKSTFNGDYYYADEKAMYDLVKAVTGRRVSENTAITGLLLRYQKAYAEASRANVGELQTSTVKTDFVANAQKLDQGRAGAYWSTNHELLARAFEAYIQDKIAGQDQGKSQYLVHGADNLFYALFGEKPYPEGQERIDINRAFENLFGTLETQPNEQALAFQLNPSGKVNALSINVAHFVDSPLEQLANRISQSFGVDIVTDPDAYQQAIEQSGALKRTGDRKPIAFRYQGKIYLSPQANENSLLHEAGGMLAEMMRSSNPELFKRGVELVRNSGYFKRIQQDNYYKTLSASDQEIEALETAIGDLGTQFVVESKRKGFLQWLAEGWKAIKQVLGLQTATPIEQMTLGEFVQKAVGDLLSGQSRPGVATPGEVQVNETGQNDLPAFQLGDGPPPLALPVCKSPIFSDTTSSAGELGPPLG